MAFIDTLMDSAKADTDLLRTLDSQGDDFAVPRDVDFLLRAPSREKAQIATGFINDCQFGSASVREQDGQHGVVVVIHMAIQQHAILSVSGFMGCVCALFGLEYDGWGCVAQVRSASPSLRPAGGIKVDSATGRGVAEDGRPEPTLRSQKSRSLGGRPMR